MLSFTVTVVPDDGEPYQVKVSTRDSYTWEKTNKGNSPFLAGDRISISALYELTVIAARRQGLYGGNLQDFVASCDISVEEEGEAEADPFAQEASATTSSGSHATPASAPRRGSKKATGR